MDNPPSLKDQALIYALSGDLPICPLPFLALAQDLGLTEDEILRAIQDFEGQGILRRFGAILVHQQSGYTANAMVVWLIPEAEIMEVGPTLANLPYVSHCYFRQTAPDWPYNLYTMLHAKSDDALLTRTQEMASLIGQDNYLILTSLKELKKNSMRYFAKNFSP
ncbi:MAG: Lrp/AsnC family transcriptional regulator [Deltaproteobacteria bacterium]|jgi:DNA-binding Lrp family transcriptional regulator|nr:Lrp/AsnC family transcriptional regulator [Deltaproteobacteria bacterium]